MFFYYFDRNCLRTHKKLHTFASSKGKKKIKLPETFLEDTID